MKTLPNRIQRAESALEVRDASKQKGLKENDHPNPNANAS